MRPTLCVLRPLEKLPPLQDSLHKQQLFPRDEMNQQVFLLPHSREELTQNVDKEAVPVLRKNGNKHNRKTKQETIYYVTLYLLQQLLLQKYMNGRIVGVLLPGRLQGTGSEINIVLLIHGHALRLNPWQRRKQNPNSVSAEISQNTLPSFFCINP